MIARLLNKVQKICEKKFVHGRYLKPITIVYDGEDSGETCWKSKKTATFTSLPIFWLDSLQEQRSTTDPAEHPSRALLQSRYRLESTERRDKEQVIVTRSGQNEHPVLHVPQLWALIINKST